MHPTILLKKLSGAACAGWFALPLLAQIPAGVPAGPSPVICGGPAALPGPGPLGTIHAHLCGFHFYSGEPARAVRVEHYCAQPNADVMQCVIYDTDRPDARLVGVEYIISEAMFVQLPAEEKQLWHSHRYEVMAGLLTAPGLSAAAEKELMRAFVTTYGKTWTLWLVDRGDRIPLGLPKLMMGFTADGQMDPAKIAARDREQATDSVKVKAQRASLATRPVAAGADGWQNGPAFQISDDLLKQAAAARQP